jgi:hypothetical protein
VDAKVRSRFWKGAKGGLKLVARNDDSAQSGGWGCWQNDAPTPGGSCQVRPMRDNSEGIEESQSTTPIPHEHGWGSR